MRRALSALREWLQLRARVREERRFHLDQAAADFRSLGFSRREANRTARVRFGSARNPRIALRELGGDVRGLAYLFHAHRVLASVWLQPAALLAATIVIFALSPAPREIVEGMIGHTLNPADRGAVSLSTAGPGPADSGITSREFDALRSMTTVTEVARYQTHDVRARAARGATLDAIRAEARARTGNRAFYAMWVSGQTRVVTGPAEAVWLFIACYGVFFLHTRRCQFGTLRRRVYGVGVASLHALVSLAGWALAIQFWLRIAWPTPLTAGLGFAGLFVAYMLVAAAQCCYWWRDLEKRCPGCLERLLLAWTQGETDHTLLSVAVTESVCAHGHGVLVESRWARQFRSEESPFQGLLHV